MKHIFVLPIILFFVSSVLGQTKYDTYTGFTVPTNAVLPASEVHPTLFFNASQAAAIKNKKTADAYSTYLWNRVDSIITYFKSKDPATQGINKQPMMAKVLAFNYILNGDTASLSRAITCLMTAYTGVPRTANTADFDGNYDEIYRATWLQNYCEAYDWVKSKLTTAQDSTIRGLIAAETVLLANNNVSGAKYAPRPHNHRSKPAYAVLTAALTLSSDSRASAWLTLALTQLNTVTKYQFSGDGVYREGWHYFIYSYVNCLPALWHYKNVSGVDHFQYYKPTFEMPLLIRSGRGWLPNIEDGYIKPFPGHMAASAYTNTSTILHPTEPLSKILQWNWKNTSFITAGYNGATVDACWDIDEYITYDPTISAVAPIVEGTYKTTSGINTFRNTTLAGTQDKYLFFNGVAESDNHMQADLLSYIIYYKNIILATDAGYGADGSSDANKNWLVSAEAHNLVTINGNGPLDYADNIGPKNNKFINSPVCDISEKEAATSAASGKIKRGILFPEKSYWIVYDLMNASTSATYALNVHSRGSLSRTNNKMTWSVSSDVYGGAAQLHSMILSSDSITFTNKAGMTSLFKDSVSQTYVNASINNSNASFLHILYPTDAGVGFPNISELSTATAKGIVLTDNVTKLQQTTLLRQTNLSSSNGKFTTDAICSWAKHDSTTLIKFAIVNGKSLNYNSTDYITSEQNVTLTADLSAVDKSTYYFDSVVTATKVTVKPSFITSDLLTVYYNGSVIPFTVVSGSVQVTISAPGKLELVQTSTGVKTESQNLNSEKNFEVKSIFPNPSNPGTRIIVEVNKPVMLGIEIYDILGKKINTLLPVSNQNGTVTIDWNGKNSEGASVPSGCYLVKFTSPNQTVSKKILTLK